MTEKDKMTKGLSYNALDEGLLTARMRAQDLCHSLLMMRPSDINGRYEILHELLPHASADMFITPPFFCDYGWNISIGKNFFAMRAVSFLMERRLP